MSTTIGIDIGFETVKVVGLDKVGKGWRLRGMAIAPCPQSPWTADKLTHLDELAKIIATTLIHTKPHPLTSRKVMMVLPESVIFASTFAMPSMPARDLAQALPLAIAEKLSVNIDEYYFDYEELTSRCRPTLENAQAVPEVSAKKDSKKEKTKTVDHPPLADSSAPQVTIFAVAAKKTLVDSIAELCRLANLELAGVDVKPGAIARAVVKADDQKARLIVDMGVGGTGASIAEGKSLRVTSTVPWGTHMIEENITAEVPDLRDKAAPVFDELVHISKFFENRICPGVKIEELILSGTGSNIPNIAEVFQQETGLPTTLADPFSQVDCAGFPVPRDMSHTFSDALGLAMRT